MSGIYQCPKCKKYFTENSLHSHDPCNECHRHDCATTIAALRRELEQALKKIRSLEEWRSGYADRCSILKKDGDQLRARLAAMTRERDAARDDLEKIAAEYQDLDERYLILRGSHDAAQAEVDTLRADVERLRGVIEMGKRGGGE